MDTSKYFANTQCPYYPCHKGADPGDFNCLFCFCPLYSLEEDCGGAFCYTKDGIKDCSHCLLPHKKEAYDRMMQGCRQVAERVRKTENKM